MIYGNIANLEEYSFLDQRIVRCFDYAGEHDLLTYEKGSHAIEGDELFVNIVEYTTTTPEERFFEAHRQYLDLHFVLSGSERIDLNFIENMKQGDFQPEKDFLPLDGESNGYIELRPGDFLICYPHDAHRTAVMVKDPEAVKKAIFKIQILQ